MTDGDCGDGFSCASSTCQPVVTELGSPCRREGACGAAQTCAPDERDSDGDGTLDTLDTTCQLERIGAGPGAPCTGDPDCHNGACAIGLCVELCEDSGSCVVGYECATMPRALSHTEAGQFDACLPVAGLFSERLAVDPMSGDIVVPVPGNAISVTLVADVGDPTLIVGLTRLQAPSGEALYLLGARDDQQLITYAPSSEISTLLLPSSTASALETGVYRGTLGVWRAAGLRSTRVPEARVIYRIGPEGHVLDVNLHFLDLAGHACPGAGLSAARASSITGSFSAQFLPAWRGALAPAGIAIGRITMDDIVGHAELDAISEGELGDLLALGSVNRLPALDVFVVRSLHPLGVVAAIGGTPGPLAHGTVHSGIVLSADAMCMMDWTKLGLAAAHATAHYLGLEDTVAADGRLDRLDSTSTGPENLMLFRLGDGFELTEEQAGIMRGSPLLR